MVGELLAISQGMYGLCTNSMTWAVTCSYFDLAISLAGMLSVSHPT